MPINSPDAPRSAEETAVILALGRTILRARTERKQTMRALATEAGISQPFLSQIENGRTMPSLLTLYRLAKALGVPTSELIPGEIDRPVIHLVRRDEGQRVPVSEARNAAIGRMLSSGSGRATTVTEYRVRREEDLGRGYVSDGELLVYVVEGSILVVIEGTGEWTLSPGDSMSYPGSAPNHWVVLGEEAIILLVHSSEDASLK